MGSALVPVRGRKPTHPQAEKQPVKEEGLPRGQGGQK